ncbi:MAG: glycosyltransferase family 39 protein [bacterium]|nr:glycosyltransferase family 39 protein [bacterium]
MRSIIQKLTFGHILILCAFPIVLALINPNWIFNTYIVDDYIYLGYQIDLPNYINWYPSNGYYFIDRISWLVPTYYIHQFFPHIIANFIVHLSVYYLAVFSIYGILNRLFHNRVALITCLLIGQFSLFLRAVGWDYVDGYSLALLSLCALLLTYAATSARARWYLMGAGAVASILSVAQFFNILYLPALGIYYLLLNHRQQRYHVVKGIFFAGMAFVVIFGIQTLYYYQLTGRWFIWQNTLRLAQAGLADDNWKNLLIAAYKTSISSWHIFYLMLLGIASWIVIFPKRFNAIYEDTTPDLRYRLRVLLLFFITSYGVLWLWLFAFDYHIFRLSFYSSAILLSAFLVLGALFAGRIHRLSESDFRIAVIITIVVSVACFTFYSQLVSVFVVPMWLISIILAILFFVFAFTAKKNASIVNMICAIALLSYVSGIDANNLRIFLPDRYANQRNYEIIIDATAIINARYDNYSLDIFHFWYDKEDPNLRTILSLSAVYLGRKIVPIGDESTNARWDDNLHVTQEIILLSSEPTPQVIIDKAQEILNPLGYDLQILETTPIQNGAITLYLIFTHIVPIAP